MINRIKFVVISSLLMALTGCGTMQSSFNRHTSYFGGANIQDASESQQLAAEYMQRADVSKSPERDQYLLKAAEQFLNARQNQQAAEALDMINTARLPTSLKDIRQLLLARLALREAKPEESLNALSRVRRQNSLSLEARKDILLAKAEAEEQLGDIIDAVKNRIAVDSMLQDERERQDNYQRIWEALMTLPNNALRSAQSGAPNKLNGWLEIANLAREGHGSQDHAILTWQNRYPNHPAIHFVEQQQRQFAESDRQGVSTAESRHIALLLPLSGKLKKSSQAIQAGFLSAYYKEKQGRTVKVYNTGSEGNVLSTYERAVNNGADLVVGPLTKNGVRQLAGTSSLTVPVLALNRLSQNDYYDNPYIYQFGLAPEDETLQVARQAWSDGHINAVVIAPDTSRGERLAREFSYAWQELGGRITDSQRYNYRGNLANSIAELLGIPSSQRRAKDIQNIIGNKVEYKPQRRKDMDMIFLVADPNTARQIKPLLAFYYAGDLPVYATSSIYTGVENSRLDGDMNGTVFCDAPWLLDKDSARFDKSDANLWPDKGSSYKRFFALGIDAYSVISELNKLQDFPGLTYHGATGDLLLERNGQISRKLPCAQFVHGTPKLIS